MNPTQSSLRAEYQKRMQHRQNVVFGSISAVMATLLVFGTLFWLNVIPFPINPEFSREAEQTEYTPCLEENTDPVDLATISVPLYNATDIEGLAGRVSETLTTAGVNVTDIANWTGKATNASAVIYTAKDAVPKAYTLRAFLPRATIVFDSTLADGQTYIVLGSDWNDKSDLVTTPSDENYSRAMTAIAQCTALDEIPDDAAAPTA